MHVSYIFCLFDIEFIGIQSNVFSLKGVKVPVGRIPFESLSFGWNCLDSTVLCKILREERFSSISPPYNPSNTSLIDSTFRMILGIQFKVGK